MHRLDRRRHTKSKSRREVMTGWRPEVEGMEHRALLGALIEPLPDLGVESGLGQVLLLDGGDTDQKFSVTSDNPNINASIINGTFLTLDVSHQSSGAGDPDIDGSITFQLFDDLTPETVDRILELVESSFYTDPTENPSASFENFPNKNFHRIATGFPGSELIIQGGSLNGNGTGNIDQPGFPFEDEFDPSLVFNGTGQLAMANAGDDTNSSQFFITTGEPRFLDFQHTIFGQLVDGQDTFDLMTQVQVDGTDTPVEPILITGTSISSTNSNGALLIDTTGASVGETANITVSSNSTDGTTDTETFSVNTIANGEDQRAFLNPVQDQVITTGDVLELQLSAVNTNPSETLTFAVGGGVASNGLFAEVENATATVDENGLVTVTPDAGFEGTIDLLVGVRDQTDRVGNLNAASNFDTDAITLTVTSNNAPTASAVEATTDEDQAVGIQLLGDSGDPDSGQTLTFDIIAQPSNGTISGFDADNGTLTYTPNAGFSGSDTFTYQVTDNGEPTPSLTSEEATVSITVNETDPVDPPPVVDTVGPTITNFERKGVFFDPTNLVLSFDEALDAVTASDLANYSLSAPGFDGFLGTADDFEVPIASVNYDEATQTVTLTPSVPLPWLQYFRLEVNGSEASGLQDTSGNLLDGDRDGVAGGSFGAIFGRGIYFDDADNLSGVAGQQVTIARAGGDPFLGISTLSEPITTTADRFRTAFSVPATGATAPIESINFLELDGIAFTLYLEWLEQRLGEEV